MTDDGDSGAGRDQPDRRPTTADRDDQPATSASRRPRSGDTDRPTLPQTSSDESDIGWGDASRRYDDDWYRDQRPPHHG